MATTRQATLSVVLVTMATAACSAHRPPLPTLPATEAASWRSPAAGVKAGADSVALSKWWERLQDATLNALIEQTLANNPDARIAQLRLRQARAQRVQAEAALWPTISASGSGSLRRSGTQVLSPDGGSGFRNITTGSYGSSLDASWEPDIFGRLGLAADAATAEAVETIADLLTTQVSLAAEVARVYGELRTFQTRFDVARRNATSQQETFELTGFRAQVGLVSNLDVEQARATLEQTRAQIPTFDANITLSTFQLALLAGREPAAMTDMLRVAAPVPVVPDEVTIGIPADVIRQRPDIKAAEARVVAETARLGSARAERYPQFTLSGSLGLQLINGAGTGGTSIVTSAAGSVLQPIFNRGRIRQQIDAQSAIQAQAIVSYESTLLTALKEVEDALVAYESHRQRLLSLQEATTAATTAGQLALSQYAAGLTDFQTVLNTQRTTLSVQDSAAMAGGDRLAAFIRLFKAIGGGWQAQVPGGVPQS